MEAFERELARYLGVAFVVSCGNGTDAIALMLQGLGAGSDDEVLIPANACVPVAAGVRLSGARLRFADVDPRTLTLDPVAAADRMGPGTTFLLAVHLYGGVADVESLARLARTRNATLLEDCAQSHGASFRGRRTGSFGRAAAFSFYPTKNLGAYGDGGAVATDDADLAQRLRALRQYGWSQRDRAESEGRNSRLDEIQAAVLRAKLPGLDEANARRRAIARVYDAAFRDLPVDLLGVLGESVSAAHLYPIRTDRRDELRPALQARGIDTEIHYPIPLHLQPAYAFARGKRGDFPVSERASETVLSLPLRPGMTDAETETVAGAVRDFFLRR